jgi:hypothetical protein
MVTIFMMNEEIARGMVCFFHQKKHSYLIIIIFLEHFGRFSNIFSGVNARILNIFRLKMAKIDDFD